MTESWRFCYKWILSAYTTDSHIIVIFSAWLIYNIFRYSGFFQINFLIVYNFFCFLHNYVCQLSNDTNDLLEPASMNEKFLNASYIGFILWLTPKLALYGNIYI
jgi:hypothetical protein